MWEYLKWKTCEQFEKVLEKQQPLQNPEKQKHGELLVVSGKPHILRGGTSVTQNGCVSRGGPIEHMTAASTAVQTVQLHSGSALMLLHIWLIYVQTEAVQICVILLSALFRTLLGHCSIKTAGQRSRFSPERTHSLFKGGIVSSPPEITVRPNHMRHKTEGIFQ